MAGGAVQGTVGVLLLIIAVALLLGGLGALVYGSMDQEENEDEGLLGPDRDRTEQNEQLVAGGAVAAGVGVVLLVLSVVFLVLAGRRDAPEAPRTGPVDLEPSAPTASVAEPDGLEPASSSGAPRGVVGVVVGVFVVAVLLVSFLALTGGGDTLFGRSENQLAGSQDFNGTLPASVVLPGVGDPSGQELQFPLDPPPDMASLQVTWTWDSTLGAETLKVALEVQRGGGWEEVVSGSGDPGGELVAMIGAADPLRIVVSRASGGSEAVDVELFVTYLR